jgi:hypothetical protein
MIGRGEFFYRRRGSITEVCGCTSYLFSRRLLGNRYAAYGFAVRDSHAFNLTM